LSILSTESANGFHLSGNRKVIDVVRELSCFGIGTELWRL